jgi:photosystem II stability/assembly factor-like uncharacterized protein
MIVAVGASGTIFSSPDANRWISRTSNATKKLPSITYGNGLFVAVGDNGTIITSDRSFAWTN